MELNILINFGHHKLTLNVAEITTTGLLVQLFGTTLKLPKDRGNAAQQTSLHTACEGNYANIVVELLAAGWVDWLPGSKFPVNSWRRQTENHKVSRLKVWNPNFYCCRFLLLFRAAGSVMIN